MQKVTKAVIPAAGLGTRVLPATKAQPKEMLVIVDKPSLQYIVEELYSFCEKVGLPTTMKEIGVTDTSKETLMKVARRSCREDECIFNDLLNVTSEQVYSAIVLADKFGKERKK